MRRSSLGSRVWAVSARIWSAYDTDPCPSPRRPAWRSGRGRGCSGRPAARASPSAAWTGAAVRPKALGAGAHPAAREGFSIGWFEIGTFFLGLDTADDVAYLVLLFVYAVLAAVALPLPVEALLPFHNDIDPLVKAAVVGAGKGIGAIVVFLVGHKVNPWLERWMSRRPTWRRFLKVLEAFVRKTGWIGLLVLLSIPFMSDTAVNYFYALLNEDGKAVPRTHFVLSNVIGGIVRTLVILWLIPVLWPG